MNAQTASFAGTPNAAAGRRRAALLEGGEQASGQRGLSLADVERLRGDRSPDARAAFAARFGRHYAGLADGETRPLADAVLDLLVRDVETKVRAALSEAIAASPEVPAATARRLARDDIAVARPVLEHSPVLDDAELEDIVRTHAMQYALAIAGRAQISEPLADALSETGHTEVVRRLVGNTGAALSAQTLMRIEADYRGDPELQERLIKRPALPYELVDRLVGAIGERLEWELVRERSISAEEAGRLVGVARERTTLGMVAREHGDHAVEREVRQRFNRGELGPEDILAHLRDGEIRAVEAGLALLAGVQPAAARTLLYGFDRRGLAALCIRAGFTTPHYVALRVALDLAEEAASRPRPRTSLPPETVRFIQDQYDKMRTDPDATAAWFPDHPRPS